MARVVLHQARRGCCSLGSGGRAWWAHFAFTRINITPIILRKKIEELLENQRSGPRNVPSLRRTVVSVIATPHAARAGRRQHDDVIEALAPDRSDEAFDVGVLPRRTRRRQHFLNADGLHVIERMIAISEFR